MNKKNCLRPCLFQSIVETTQHSGDDKVRHYVALELRADVFKPDSGKFCRHRDTAFAGVITAKASAESHGCLVSNSGVSQCSFES